ncbi:MAG: glycosyltransferase family 4 protein [Chloroflexota bacterium]
MRIALVTATFPPYLAGTGQVCYHNARGLVEAGHDVTVFTADVPRVGHPDPERIDVQRLPVWFRVGNAPVLPGLLGMGRFDLIHLHYPFYFGAEPVLLTSLVSGVPYVVTYHQDVLLRGPLRYPEMIHHRLLGTRILARARVVLATSLDYARSSRLRPLIERGAVRVDELPNGVDARRFHPDVDVGDLRDRCGIRSGERVILFVGALDRPHYFKGVAVLLSALGRLPDLTTRLLVVGEGELLPNYRELAVRLGLADRVSFRGRVSEAELPAHYALADALVLPSTTRGEAFGLALLEALACQTPVIASNLPGVRSVVSDGEDGLLAAPGDARDLADKIQSLLDDPERRHRMGALGRAKVVERYGWDRITARLEAIYRRVLDRSTDPISVPAGSVR